MVFIAAHEVGDVPFRPLFEIDTVAEVRRLPFGLFPLVKNFVHYQEAVFVAQVHELR